MAHKEYYPHKHCYQKHLDTPEARRKVFYAYCEWMAAGKMKKSFYFDDGIDILSWQQIKSYMKEFPEDMPKYLLDIATAKGIGKWEEEVFKAARGENPDANVACLQIILRNKCRWDRGIVGPEDEEDDEATKKPFQEVIRFFQELKEASLLSSEKDKELTDGHTS